jgi:hypothetical protein
MGGRVPEARHMKMRIDAHQGYPGELATIVGRPLDLQRTLLVKSPLSRDSPHSYHETWQEACQLRSYDEKWRSSWLILRCFWGLN